MGKMLAGGFSSLEGKVPSFLDLMPNLSVMPESYVLNESIWDNSDWTLKNLS